MNLEQKLTKERAMFRKRDSSFPSFASVGSKTRSLNRSQWREPGSRRARSDAPYLCLLLLNPDFLCAFFPEISH